MIVVRVDLDSAHGAEFDEHLFTMIIGNDGSGSGSRGNYNVFLGRRGVTDARTIINSPLRRGRVLGHARLSTHVGKLVSKALKAVNL